MVHDGVVKPLPPVQLIMDRVSAKLSGSRLVEVKPFTALQHDKAWQVISANYFEDGGEKIRQICAESGEELRPLTAWMMEECQKNEKLIGSTQQKRRAARDTFRQLYSTHWNASDVDVVIAPVTPSVAPPLDTSRYWPYTAVWNLLDYPAIVFPASSMVDGYGQDLRNILYSPDNEAEKYFSRHYDPEVAQKMPVGLQVVAKRLMDSECLAAAQIIEKALTE
jgi:amidase